MLDFVKVKTDLEESFNREKSIGVDIDINVTVLSESDGKFSVSVFDEKCFDEVSSCRYVAAVIILL